MSGWLFTKLLTSNTSLFRPVRSIHASIHGSVVVKNCLSACVFCSSIFHKRSKNKCTWAFETELISPYLIKDATLAR